MFVLNAFRYILNHVELLCKWILTDLSVNNFELPMKSVSFFMDFVRVSRARLNLHLPLSKTRIKKLELNKSFRSLRVLFESPRTLAHPTLQPARSGARVSTHGIIYRHPQFEFRPSHISFANYKFENAIQSSSHSPCENMQISKVE